MIETFIQSLLQSNVFWLLMFCSAIYGTFGIIKQIRIKRDVNKYIKEHGSIKL